MLASQSRSPMLLDHKSQKHHERPIGTPLSAEDAIDIWIARWLRIRPKDLIARYGCDPRRLYEIWAEDKFPGSRDRARAIFARRHPGLVDRIDYGPHRRISSAIDEDLQPGLFDDLAEHSS